MEEEGITSLYFVGPASNVKIRSIQEVLEDFPVSRDKGCVTKQVHSHGKGECCPLEAIDIETGERLVLNREQCEFTYRDSIFKNMMRSLFLTPDLFTDNN